MSRAKVLSVLDVLHYGGDENRVLQLATTIDPTQFDFRVSTLRADDLVFDRRFGSIAGEYAKAGIDIVRLGGIRRTLNLPQNDARRHLLRTVSLAQNVWNLVRYVRRERIDLIDAHHGPGYLCGVAAAAICGIPSVMTTYNVREAWSPRALWFVAHQLTLAGAGAIVTDSEPVAQELRNWMLRKNHPHVYVIPNGPPLPDPTRPSEDVRRELGVPPQGAATVVGHIATLVPEKGQHILIDAAPAVLRKHPNVYFLIIGFERADSAGYANELRRRAHEKGVGERVIIAPYQGEIGDVWQVIDVQAHPTMLDSLPNSILQGMALAKPLVASAIAGIPSLVLNDETGLVIPPGDVGALSDALIRLLSDDALAERLGSAARRRYEGGYTPRHLTTQMAKLFETLIAGRTAR